MKKIFFLLTFILTSSLFAQSDIITAFDQNITQQLFSGNWQASDSLIDLKLGVNPKSVKYNSLKAYNYFFTRYIGNNNTYSRDQSIRQVQKFSWEAIENGEEIEESLANNFYMGIAYSLLARVNVMSQEFWTAYWNASKAEGYLEEALEENPKLVDAYLTLGVHEYFPAVGVTGYQSVLAWFGGMSGDKELGISHLKNVADNGKLFKSEANYILGLLFGFRENNYTLAYEYWNNLNSQFPTNINFLRQKERAYFSKLVEEKGVNFLEEEFDSLETRYNVNDPNVLNNIGYNLVNQERFDDALLVFKVNLKKYPEIANCYDSLAECYMNRGENENAIKYYKLAFEKLKTDTTVNEQFRERLEEGIRNNLKELSSKIDV